MGRARRVRPAGILLAGVAIVASCRIVPDPLDDIGTLGSSFAIAHAVNDRGVIVGTSSRSDPPGRYPEAFRFDPATGVMTGLGVLQEAARSSAVDINEDDLAVGTAGVWSFTIGELSHAVAFDPDAGIVDLNDSLGYWHESGATAVNDENVVVGWAIRYFSLDLPFVTATLDFALDLDTGVVTPLPFAATDINDAGLVVGSSGGHAASYDLQTGVQTDLGTLGGSSSAAEAVNEHGVIVGAAATASGVQHAFRFDPVTGTMTDLGGFGSYSVAYGINDRGNVVGSGWHPDGGQRGFFAWEGGGPLTDVGTLDGSEYVEALDINNSDVVVGSAVVLGYGRAWHTTIRFLPHESG